MATFNILSSCICRDAFGFQQECKHDIITFLQATSALTWFRFNKKPLNPMTLNMLEESGLSNFQKKCIIKDYNKEVLASYDKETDYFVMDLTELASANIAEYGDAKIGENDFCSYTKWFNTAYNNGLKKYLPSQVVIHNSVELLKDESLLQQTIDNIRNWLLNVKGYKEKQIILVRNKKVNAYTDNKVLVYFDNQSKRNSINDTLDRIYDCFCEKIPGCHVINMPLGTYSDKFHKWGVTDLHFCREFYDYLYKCFDLIASGKENEIQQEFYHYSKIMMENREKFILNSIYANHKENLVSNDFDNIASGYIIKKGTIFYKKNIDLYIVAGRTNKAFSITEYRNDYSKFQSNDRVLFAASNDCKKGFTGHGIEIGDTNWKLQNQSTMVEIDNQSIIISHNGSNSKAQMQIISTLKDDNRELSGEVVTLSVWARVLEKNDAGKGGCISFINANDYNGGKFCAKEEFVNTEWKRISVSYWVPEGKEYKGLTICLRALAGEEENAKVEFRNPIVQIGSFAF